MVYELELGCDYPGWWQYNIFISMVGYDEDSAQVCVEGYSDRIADVWGDESRTPPPGWDANRPAKASCGPCHMAKAFVYAIANSLPGSRKVADSPDFSVVITARADGREIFRRSYDVNHWGGLAIANLELRAE